MPLLVDEKSINEAVRDCPEEVHRLWIEQGHERAAQNIMELAKAKGVSFRVLPRHAFMRKFKDAKGHICLEKDDFAFTNPDQFLQELAVGEMPFICAFDGVSDPQNLGNIVRSAVCLSAQGIIIPKDRCCGVTEAVHRVSRGATEHARILRVTNLARYLGELKRTGVFCYGVDEHGETPLWDVDLRGPVCLVLGGEDGMRRLTRETCDTLVSIPTTGLFPTLNVATAFAISAYEVLRQRLRSNQP